MQLFHLDSQLFHIQGNNLKLFPVPELSSQLRKVMRIKKGDHISVQFNDEKGTSRFEIEITNRTDKDVEGNIISSQNFDDSGKNISMLIAMPNKWEKAELIVQKLTEIGIKSIGFWASEHSIIRQRNEKKAERLEKISREAVEQSRGLSIPEIKFYENSQLQNFINGKTLILANMGGESILNKEIGGLKNICGIIGPEGGFGKSDLALFSDAIIVDLGKGILRMETAAIIMAWVLTNN